MNQTPTTDFWGCNCEKNSLHSFEETKCKICGMDKRDGHEILIEDIIYIVNNR